MKCQTGNCPDPGTITVIVSCHIPHLTETRCCRKHLNIIKELYRQHKLWCHCQQPIITGMYNDHNQVTRKLDERNIP